MEIEIGGIEKHLKDNHGVLEGIGFGQCPFKFSELRDELLEHLYKHRHVGIICDRCGDADKVPDKFFKYVNFREH